jgi:DNA-binding protein HU-beta
MSKVGKSELIDLIAEATGESKKTVKNVLEAFTQGIETSLAEGKSVSITGFGTFEKRHRQARDAVKPGTTERIKVPASDYPAFKAGKSFKDAVNKSPF